ncbi:sigma-54 dependent transcriptional regulator [Lentilitoribacter sp. Alg239-R112]|uniref:sigma-54-dependent transcriptional regulator n=1 Tax=Lentilitoribacter sp. Alg239-R112 TaxID=2305987 RepID=UPI0013A6F187|nr:sigma-54 dependent transcriptional regulator [Lentilitoribacter sp. Alg239-R112]
MNNEFEILFIDDEEHLRNAVSQKFQLSGLNVRTFEDANLALDIIGEDSPFIVISDIRMPLMDGFQLLSSVLDKDQDIPVIMLTGHGDIKLSVDAMRSGAYDFIEKPFDPDHLVEVAKKAIAKRKIILENRTLRLSLTKQDNLESQITGQSAFATELRNYIKVISPIDTDILITGATGTGKEVVARSIHSLSRRKEKPFTVINCGALSDDQMEGTLFGHEQGAFYGAVRSRFGKLETARGGTVFLDGIDASSPELQLKLLRVVEDRTTQRLGSNEIIELDVRFIAAASDGINSFIENGKFRADLWHRLNQIELKMLPLAERTDDIPELFIQLMNEASVKYGREISTIPRGFMSKVLSHDWPGNIRELKHEADRYVLGLSKLGEIDENTSSYLPLADQLMIVEKQLIIAELKSANGVLKSTQEALGLSRKSLYEKMRKHGLDKNDYR